jgi:putative ABC transport system ATP-binding protein
VEALSGPNFGPVSFSIEAGKCLCLSGPSGAGKTIILRAIVDLDVHRGEVMLGNQACSLMTGPAWRKRVGYLPAHSSWWYETAAPHMPAVDSSALDSMGFEKDILDKPISRLSTGEQQRLALLRLLENKPEVLLLDEPTASLDVANVNLVESLVEKYRTQHKVAVLWVSHDKEQTRRVATGQIRIEQGQFAGETSW